MPAPALTPTVFALLDTEWATLAPTPLPTRWHHPARILLHLGVCHPTLGDLLRVTERRDDPAQSDQVLAALADLATGAANTDDGGGGLDGGHDALAARTLLQTLLPGAKALARRLGWLGDPQERAAAVTATLYEQIRSYRLPGRLPVPACA